MKCTDENLYFRDIPSGSSLFALPMYHLQVLKQLCGICSPRWDGSNAHFIWQSIDTNINRLKLNQNVLAYLFMRSIVQNAALALSGSFTSNQMLKFTLIKLDAIEPVHEISKNVVCATSKASDQPAHTHSLIWAFACPLNIQWILLERNFQGPEAPLINVLLFQTQLCKHYKSSMFYKLDFKCQTQSCKLQEVTCVCLTNSLG